MYFESHVDGDYYHLTGRVVQQYVRLGHETWGHARGADEDLIVTCQGTLSHPADGVYGWRVEYRPSSVQLVAAEAHGVQVHSLAEGMREIDQRIAAWSHPERHLSA